MKASYWIQWRRRSMRMAEMRSDDMTWRTMMWVMQLSWRAQWLYSTLIWRNSREDRSGRSRICGKKGQKLRPIPSFRGQSLRGKSGAKPPQKVEWSVIAFSLLIWAFCRYNKKLNCSSDHTIRAVPLEINDCCTTVWKSSFEKANNGLENYSRSSKLPLFDKPLHHFWILPLSLYMWLSVTLRSPWIT